MVVENPFKYGGIVTGPYFADRAREISELFSEMRNLGRVFLVSPRRYGKTCLIFNLRGKLKKEGYRPVYLDLNAYPGLASFAVAVTEKVSKALESSADKLAKLISALKYLRPRIEVGPDGSLAAGVEMIAPGREALPALLEGLHYCEQLAAKKGQKLVIAIDEFSDLAKYDGQIVEKAIRSEIQSHTHIGYIFSGSSQSVMLAMVRDTQRAFYRLGRIMELGPIERDEYMKFILKWFKKGGYRLKEVNFEVLFDAAEDVPYSIQRMCNILWEKGRSTRAITQKMVEQLPMIVARQDSAHFELIWQGASQGQKILLMALAREQDPRPFSKDFQFTYGIGPSSSIKASLDSLVKKGILYKMPAGKYKFADTFMRYWILNLAEADSPIPHI
ncbi:MAG: ATP-binding protein [Deltaproteobacteria bacterium]|nr:ATP-binding protein [Deltaproteobacteria bacterium]